MLQNFKEYVWFVVAPATRTQRIINGRPAAYNDPTILVSAKEKYESRCRHCHQVFNQTHDE